VFQGTVSRKLVSHQNLTKLTLRFDKHVFTYLIKRAKIFVCNSLFRWICKLLIKAVAIMMNKKLVGNLKVALKELKGRIPLDELHESFVLRVKFEIKDGDKERRIF